MEVTRMSIISGVVRTRDINITEEQLNRFQNGELIQRVAPHLSADDREFLISGISSDEWNTICEPLED